MASVSFKIVIPQTSTSQRSRPAYVSSATQSATITVTPSGGSTGSPTAINCNTTSLTCSGSVSAPVGSDTFTVNLYSGTNGGGNLLSTGTVTQTIVAGQANSVNVTFNGVVASLSVTIGAATMGTAATAIPVTVNALDAAGNVIVGPGGFIDANGNPVTTIALTDSDASGATTLSTSALSAPGTSVTLSYSGAVMNTAPTITATAGALTANATLTFPHGDVTFAYTGAVQNYTAPSGVSQITVTALGAEGDGLAAGGTAGLGASVTATLPVTAGEALYVYAGGWGTNGGFNGGGDGGSSGAGGGASDVRTSTTAALTGNAATDPRLIVAGGGGSTALGQSAGGNGGAVGGDGGSGASSNPGGGGGGGGTQTAGGAGGSGSAGPSGASGMAGPGGTGDGGGNGGGGWFGGGGGGLGGLGVGGGGGGSSFVEATATNVSSTAGGNSGENGQVTFSW
jgi:hypothetical protein